MNVCTQLGHTWGDANRCQVCGVFVPGDCHMELASGAFLDLAAPAPVMTLDDVAHGLSHACRYAGQSRRFYSVAEHAVLVSIRLMILDASPDVQLVGLHHDDAEAFIGDVTRPMKHRVPDVVALESDVFAVTCAALGLDDLPFDDPVVKEADIWALAAESYHLLPSRGANWFSAGLYDPADRLTPRLFDIGVTPDEAKVLWLQRHALLRGRLT